MNKRGKLIASPNRGDPPPFNRLDAKVFEEMCCALLDKEPDVTTADLYMSQREKTVRSGC